MKTKLYNSILTYILYLFVHTSLFAQTDNYPEDFHIYPYLQYATPNSIIIKWETVNPIVGKVAYSEDDSFSNEKSEPYPVKIHEIKLDNLKPGTRYYYKVSYKNTMLESASLTTAPVPGTPNWRMGCLW